MTLQEKCQARCVGILTIERHRYIEQSDKVTLRVLVDGQDVTDRCFVADDRQGYAGVFLCDLSGRKVILRSHGNDWLVRYLKTGDVQFVAIARLPEGPAMAMTG